MAKISTGTTFGLNARVTQACRILAEGGTEDDVLLICLKTSKSASKEERSKAKRTLHKWMRMPGFAECYRSIVREVALQGFGRATKRIIEQMDDSNGWLANKAANDVLTRFAPSVMGENEREVVVRVEGMPTLGAPEVVDYEALPEGEGVVQ